MGQVPELKLMMMMMMIGCRMFFLDGKFLSGCLCTLKSKKNQKKTLKT